MTDSSAILVILAGVAVIFVLLNEWTSGGQSGSSDQSSQQAIGTGIALGEQPQFIIDTAQAIAVAEGYGVEGAIPTRANNPGDLTDVGQNFPGDTGQRIGQNIIVFATPTDGWNALYAQIRLWLSGNSHVVNPTDSISIIAMKYAPDNPTAWAANVSAQLSAKGYNAGIDVPLNQIQMVTA